MSKYQPLNDFLRHQSREHVPMTFAEIERVLRIELPHSKTHRAWWSNNPNNNVMTKEWLSAGYETESVDIAGEKLVFRRIKNAGRPAEAVRTRQDGPVERALHPGLGFLAGLITIEPGFDVTEPFGGESWDASYLGADDLPSAGSRGTGS